MLDKHLGSTPEEQPERAENPYDKDGREDGKDERVSVSRTDYFVNGGATTENRWYSNASSIDAREEKTCANIKAAGITLYTVQVNTGSDPTSPLLQNCASDTSKFFLLTSAEAMVATFNQIGTALSNLRLAM